MDPAVCSKLRWLADVPGFWGKLIKPEKEAAMHVRKKEHVRAPAPARASRRCATRCSARRRRSRASSASRPARRSRSPSGLRRRRASAPDRSASSAVRPDAGAAPNIFGSQLTFSCLHFSLASELVIGACDPRQGHSKYNFPMK